MYVSAEQLVFIPMLVLVPIEWVPLLVAAAGLLSVLPEIMSGTWHHQRVLYAFSDSWFAIGPVLVILALAPEVPSLDDWGVYVAAFVAQVVFDLGAGADPRQPADPPAPDRVPALLAGHRPGGRHPGARSRSCWRWRHGSTRWCCWPSARWCGCCGCSPRTGTSATRTTLELNRAYRGTVMLLADVVESDDGYTGEHSRSVVELVQAVMDHLHVDPATRQEMEFAALLHDVGKISIPKDILNKPAKLTAEEFELMKTHTVEGQFLLDRVGGLLGRIGEVVRSCHERWDGKGYPDGLKGEQIPLAARIVFVCDAYNAMTTDRPYRSAMSTRGRAGRATGERRDAVRPHDRRGPGRGRPGCPAREPCRRRHADAALRGAAQRRRHQLTRAPRAGPPVPAQDDRRQQRQRDLPHAGDGQQLAGAEHGHQRAAGQQRQRPSPRRPACPSGRRSAPGSAPGTSDWMSRRW